MTKTNEKKNNYFATKAAYGKVYGNLKKAHPEWTNARLYEVTRNIMEKRTATAKA